MANLGSEYSLVNFGDEAQIRINQMADLCKRSDAIYDKLPEEYKDFLSAYYYMLRARYSMERNIYQRKISFIINKGALPLLTHTLKLLDAHNQISDLDYYNKQLSDGKWDGAIDHIVQYNSFLQFPENHIR